LLIALFYLLERKVIIFAFKANIRIGKSIPIPTPIKIKATFFGGTFLR